jgi:SAM-dependent methyltransferase
LTVLSPLELAEINSAETPMEKTYDRAYFDRWYHDRPGRKATLTRKVTLALAIAEYYLQRPIRSVLDVGCGEAAWRAPLLKLRPGLRYQGVDSSEYAVARHGRRRNIALASFGQLDQLRFGAPADLLVCSDVLHYVPTGELRRGLSGFEELCDGVAFLEVFGNDDAILGDTKGFMDRPASFYRRAFRTAGFVPCGSHGYLSPNLRGQATKLEVLAP